jgi:hypothetical protein
MKDPIKTKPYALELSQNLYVDFREPAPFSIGEGRSEDGSLTVMTWSPETTRKRSAIAEIEIRQSPFENPRPSGDYSAVAPPVPIPNTAVKRCSPDGSTAIGCARVGRRQN